MAGSCIAQGNRKWWNFLSREVAYAFFKVMNVKSAVVGGIRFVIQPTQMKTVGHLADKLFCWLEAVACLGNYLNSPRPSSPAE